MLQRKTPQWYVFHRALEHEANFFSLSSSFSPSCPFPPHPTPNNFSCYFKIQILALLWVLIRFKHVLFMFLASTTPPTQLNLSQIQVQIGMMHRFQIILQWVHKDMAQMLVVYRESSRILSEHGSPTKSPGGWQLGSFLLSVTQGIRYSLSKVHLFPR